VCIYYFKVSEIKLLIPIVILKLNAKKFKSFVALFLHLLKGGSRGYNSNVIEKWRKRTKKQRKVNVLNEKNQNSLYTRPGFLK